MPDVNAYVAIRRLAIVGWTPVICPIACSQVVIQNADPLNAQAVRTDPLDPNTEKPIAVSMELTLRASMICWAPGTVICYVGSTLGAGPAIVSFLR